MKSRFLLDVVVSQSSSVFQLLSSEDKSLLIGGNSLLVLDLGLNVLDRIGGLNVQGNGFSGQGLNEDLHTTSQSQHQMKSRFLLDVVVSQSSSVFQLLSGEDKSLLIGGDSLLVLDLGLNVLDRIGSLNVQGNGFSGQSLNEDLHTTSQSQHQMKS